MRGGKAAPWARRGSTPSPRSRAESWLFPEDGLRYSELQGEAREALLGFISKGTAGDLGERSLEERLYTKQFEKAYCSEWG